MLVYGISRLNILKYKSVVAAFFVADAVLGGLTKEVLLTPYTWLVWLSVLFSGMIRSVAEMGNYETMELSQVKAGMILSTASSVLLAGDPGSG